MTEKKPEVLYRWDYDLHDYVPVEVIESEIILNPPPPKYRPVYGWPWWLFVTILSSVLVVTVGALIFL